MEANSTQKHSRFTPTYYNSNTNDLNAKLNLNLSKTGATGDETDHKK